MRFNWSVGVVGVLICVFGSSIACASEKGASAYPLGVNTIMAGGMPDAEKTWIQSYTAYYHANAFADSKGRNSIPGFKADVVVNATRIFHDWGIGPGPFHLLSGIVVPISHTEVEPSQGSPTNLGVGDIELQPLYLGYTSKNKRFFGFTGVDVYVPSDTEVSNKFYALNPSAYMTWMLRPNLELSTVISVEFHTKNGNTHYKSGTLMANDWGVDYKPMHHIQGLSAGVGGYMISQLTDDEVDGVRFQDGYRQRGVAVGPQLSYGSKRIAVGVKWQQEFQTENRPRGNKLWFQLMIPLKL